MTPAPAAPGALWLVGCGYMGREYAKVLNGLSARFLVVGRGNERAEALESEAGCTVVRGGLSAFLSEPIPPVSTAIVAVNVEETFDVASMLIEHGIKRLLIEKPGAMSKAQLAELERASGQREAQAFVAYNRRFYSSVARAVEIIADDGGPTSIHYEFTEWAHQVAPLAVPDAVKRFWLVANSSHVIDLAFFLAGRPAQIATFQAGQIDWHPNAAVFSGAGTTESGALFSYCANWAAPGRWSVEVMTRRHRLLFRPLETLQVQKHGSLTWEPVDVDGSLDQQYKPGLFLQTRAFLQNDASALKTLSQQRDDFDVWCRMAGYSG